MKCARGATGYAATTFLSSARLPGEELSEGGTAREGRGGYERGREGEGLMGLSGETVIVRGWWVKPGAGADGWACVPSTRQPGPAVEMVQGGGGQHRRHCVSLQLLSSDTRRIVHLNAAALSAGRQPSRALPGARLLPALIISQAGPLRKLPAAQTAAEEVTNPALHFKRLSQNAVKLLTRLASLAVLHPAYFDAICSASDRRQMQSVCLMIVLFWCCAGQLSQF